MLGSIVLFACLAASGVVACILFVLFGPVPVNRRVTIVSRIQPAPMPVMAAPVMIQPAMAFAAPIAPIEAFEPPPELQFTPPPPPPARRRAHAVDGPVVAPRVVRRPRSEPMALPRTRAARGTEARPRDGFDSIEVTHRETAAFDADDHTTVDPAFS